jgi:hypothetical protein
VLPADYPDETQGDQRPVIEALMRALKSFVDRLGRAETPGKSDAKEKA